MNNSNLLKLMLVALSFQMSGLTRAMDAQRDTDLAKAIELSNKSAEEEDNLVLAVVISTQVAQEENKKRQEEKIRAEEKAAQIALDLAIATALADGNEPVAQLVAPKLDQPAAVPVMPAPKQDKPVVFVPKPVIPAKPQVPAEKQTCTICLDDKNNQDMVNLNCKHAFCKGCLIGLVDTAIKDKNTKGLRCPEPKCKLAISQEDVAKITRDEQKIKMIGEIQFNEWATINAKNCPTPGCTYVFVNDDNDAHKLTCPKCIKQFCTGCLLQHGRAVSCADAKLATDKNRANKANDDWVKKNTKSCPRCKMAVQKDGGCKYILCQNCHEEFCWSCLAKSTKHVHDNGINCDAPLFD